MLDRYVDFLLATLLLAFFLPLLVWYAIVATVSSRRPHHSRFQLFKISLLKRQIAGEFSFERAIGAYEDLIDSTFAQRPQ